MGMPSRSDEPIARNPLSWQRSARTHIHSANVLFRDYDKRFADEGQELYDDPLKDYVIHSVNTVFLLYAIAIENLVKGIIIARHIEQPFQNGSLNEKLVTHDLIKLCDLARLNYTRTKKDNKLLDLLSEVTKSGKYPISKKFPDHMYVRHPYLQHNPPEAYHCMREHVLRLLTMLERELRDTSSNPTLENETDLAVL